MVPNILIIFSVLIASCGPKNLCYPFGILVDVGTIRRSVKSSYDYNVDASVNMEAAKAILKQMPRVKAMENVHMREYQDVLNHNGQMYQLVNVALNEASKRCDRIGNGYQVPGVADNDELNYLIKIMLDQSVEKLPVAIERRAMGYFNFDGTFFDKIYNRALSADAFNSRFPFLYQNASLLPSTAADDTKEVLVACRKTIDISQSSQSSHYSLKDFYSLLNKGFKLAKPLLDGASKLSKTIPKGPYVPGNELKLRPTNAMETVLHGIATLSTEQGFMSETTPRWVQSMTSAISKVFKKSSSFLETDLTPLQVDAIKAALHLKDTIIDTAAKFIPKKASDETGKFHGLLVLDVVPPEEHYNVARIDPLVLESGKMLKPAYMVTSSEKSFVIQDLSEIFGTCALQPILIDSNSLIEDYELCNMPEPVDPTYQQMECAKSLVSGQVDDSCDWITADYPIMRRVVCEGDDDHNAIISSPHSAQANVICQGRQTDVLSFGPGLTRIQTDCGLELDGYELLDEIVEGDGVPPINIPLIIWDYTEIALYSSLGGILLISIPTVSCLIYFYVKSKRALKKAKSQLSLHAADGDSLIPTPAPSRRNSTAIVVEPTPNMGGTANDLLR